MRTIGFLVLMRCLFPVICYGQALPDSIKVYESGSEKPIYVLRYYYNDQGEMIEELKDNETGWDYRTNNTYQDGKLVQQQSGYIDGNFYTLTNRIQWFYDEQGRDTLYYIYKEDSTISNPEILGGWKTIYTLDTLDRVIDIIKMQYHKQEKEFFNYYRTRICYADTSRNPDSTLNYGFVDSDWLLHGFIVERGWTQGWFPRLLEFKPQYRLHRYLNGNQEFVTRLDTFQYFGFGKIVQSHYYLDSNSNPVLAYKLTTVSDFRDNQILYEASAFGQNGEVDYYSGTSKYYYYNPDFSVRFHVDTTYNSNGVNSIMKYEYYYKGVFTGLSESAEVYSLYPNPVQSGGQLFLPNKDWTNALLFSLDGKKVELNINYNLNSIQLPHMKPGIYLLRLEDREGKPYQSKIQVQ